MRSLIILMVCVFSIGLFAQDESTTQNLMEHLRSGDKTAAKVDVDKLFKTNTDGSVPETQKVLYDLINTIIDSTLNPGQDCEAVKQTLHELFSKGFTKVMDVPSISLGEEKIFALTFRNNFLQAVAKGDFSQCKDDSYKKIIAEDLKSIIDHFYDDHNGGRAKTNAWYLLGTIHAELSK